MNAIIFYLYPEFAMLLLHGLLALIIIKEPTNTCTFGYDISIMIKVTFVNYALSLESLVNFFNVTKEDTTHYAMLCGMQEIDVNEWEKYHHMNSQNNTNTVSTL